MKFRFAAAAMIAAGFDCLFSTSTAFAIGPQFATPDECRALRTHRAREAEIGLIKGAILWNGAEVTHKQFDLYVKEERAKTPKIIFHIKWDDADLKILAEITDEIHTAGFPIALNCPPIPF